MHRSLDLLRRVAASAVLVWCGLLHAGAALAQSASTASPPAITSVATAANAAAPSAASPYGLAALWSSSDLVARSVLGILVIMSVGSWYIMVVKLLEQSRINRQAGTMDKRFWAAGSVREGASALEASSPFRFIAEYGSEALGGHKGLKGHIPMAEWVPMSIQASVERVQGQAQRGLAFLATVGSTSPFVGLFGTVWGIYHALTAIGVSGQASIDKVAGPVGEALIMTAIGLAVAIPAVLGYNWLARRNKVVMDKVRAFSEELNAVLLGSAGKAA
jgi:biopolymer transport protein ExbB